MAQVAAKAPEGPAWQSPQSAGTRVVVVGDSLAAGQPFAAALALHRCDRSGVRTPDDDAAPWLSFQALIYGSPELLRQYPQPELLTVRKAWAAVKNTT